MPLTYPRLKTGLWALHRGKVGIINNLGGPARSLASATGAAGQPPPAAQPGACEFHYVNDTGETIGAAMVPLDELDMPKREHLPAKRLTDIHPDWQPGDDIRYTDEYAQRTGLGGKPTPEGDLTGVNSLEFVADAKEFKQFRPEHRSAVAHVRDPETGAPHDKSRRP